MMILATKRQPDAFALTALGYSADQARENLITFLVRGLYEYGLPRRTSEEP